MGGPLQRPKRAGGQPLPECPRGGSHTCTWAHSQIQPGQCVSHCSHVLRCPWQANPPTCPDDPSCGMHTNPPTCSQATSLPPHQNPNQDMTEEPSPGGWDERPRPPPPSHPLGSVSPWGRMGRVCGGQVGKWEQLWSESGGGGRVWISRENKKVPTNLKKGVES